MTTSSTPTPVADWPVALADLCRTSFTCEYASLTSDGRPITWPVTPYPGPDGTTVDVSTGLTYPSKAERARRDPRVAVLFSTVPAGPAGPAPVVLVQGAATVRDADLQANLDRYLRESMEKAPEAYRQMPRLALRRMAWYFARVWVQVTPLRVTWWPEGRLDREPQRWRAPEGTTAPPSDPAPTGPALGSGWSRPPGDWHSYADRAERLGPPVLTLADRDGWPLPVRCTASERTADGFLLTPPAGSDAGAGAACLTAHRADPAAGSQENVVLVGTAEPAGDGRVHLRVERALSDWSLTGSRLTRVVGFLRNGRPLAARLHVEAARRGQPAPRVRL